MSNRESMFSLLVLCADRADRSPAFGAALAADTVPTWGMIPEPLELPSGEVLEAGLRVISHVPAGERDEISIEYCAGAFVRRAVVSRGDVLLGRPLRSYELNLFIGKAA